MLERVLSGAEFALPGSGAGSFFSVGTVSGELGGGNGLGRLRSCVRELIRDRLRIWGLVFHRSHSSKRLERLTVRERRILPK